MSRAFEESNRRCGAGACADRSAARTLGGEARIRHFKSGRYRGIVAVSLVSEGADTPRARPVRVRGTTSLDPPFWGRRSVRGPPEQTENGCVGPWVGPRAGALPPGHEGADSIGWVIARAEHNRGVWTNLLGLNDPTGRADRTLRRRLFAAARAPTRRLKRRTLHAPPR